MTALALDPPRLAAPALSSDEALARRAGAGDDAAYAAIYARYHARIEAYCRAIVRHDEDARDAAQTAMTKALVAMRAERGGAAHLRPWLFRIAHNEALTVLRRRRHHDELTEALEGRDGDPIIDVLLREELRGMFDALAALPASHREALLLRVVGGLDYDTVAAVVGMTPRAARQAVFRARSALRSERRAAEQSRCPEIRLLLAGHDGRRRRGRRVRAHLRACSACREWDAARRQAGGALSALPAGVTSAASWLWSWIGGAAASSPGTIGAAAAAKVVTGVAVIAAGTAPIAQREIVHRAAPPPPAKRQSAADTRRVPVVARRAPVAAPVAQRAAVHVPSTRAASPAPDRHPAAPAADSPSRAARVGAPRGRDGAPGGRGPSGGGHPAATNVREVRTGFISDGRSLPPAPAAPAPPAPVR